MLGRYQYSRAGQDSLTLDRRCDRFMDDLADNGQGSEVHSIYLGLNYLFYQDRLKFLTGVKWPLKTTGAAMAVTTMGGRY